MTVPTRADPGLATGWSGGANLFQSRQGDLGDFFVTAAMSKPLSCAVVEQDYSIFNVELSHVKIN